MTFGFVELNPGILEHLVYFTVKMTRKRGGFDYQLPQGEFFFFTFLGRSNGIMKAIRLRIKISFE